MRILFVSNSPLVPSSYGQQCRYLLPGIKALGHEVAILCCPGYIGQMPTDWNGITLYSGSVGNTYSQDTVAKRAEQFKADLVISFMDCFVIDPARYPDTAHLPYYPVVYDKLSRREFSVLSAPNNLDLLSYSKYGQAKSAERGLTAKYIPLGVDTSIFRPMHTADCRNWLGLPLDALVFGVVAANNDPPPSRKGWDELFQAFALFRKQNPHINALLYCHTNPSGAINLFETVQTEGIGEWVRFPALDNLDGTPIEDMAKIYNAMDWLIMPSRGEGAGLPLLEAQSCSVPVIAGEWTGMGEHIFGGIKIPTVGGSHQSEVATGHEWRRVFSYAMRIDVLADAMTYAANMHGDRKADLADLGKQKVRELFDWSVILPQWEKVLSEWEHRLQVGPSEGRRTLRTDLKSCFCNEVIRAQESQASVVIVCPSWGEKCGIAEYSGYMLWELFKAGHKAVIARSMAEAEKIITACSKTPYPIKTLIVQQEYSFWDGNSYLSQGETTDDMLRIVDRLDTDTDLELNIAIVQHSVMTDSSHEAVHHKLANSACLYVTSEDGRRHLRNNTRGGAWLLPLGTWTVPGWGPKAKLPLYDPNSAMITIGNFGMFGPQRRIRDQIALCKATGSRFLGSFAQDDPRVKPSIEELLKEAGVEGQVFTDWPDDRTILARLSECDIIYMPRNSGCYYSSASVRLALNAHRPIIVNDDTGYSDLPLLRANDLEEAKDSVDLWRNPDAYHATVDAQNRWASENGIVQMLTNAGLL